MGAAAAAHQARASSTVGRYARSMNTAAAPVVPWLAAVADAMDEALWVWDAADGRVVFATAAFRRQYGAAAGELGAGADVLLARVHADDAQRVRALRGG